MKKISIILTLIILLAVILTACTDDIIEVDMETGDNIITDAPDETQPATPPAPTEPPPPRAESAQIPSDANFEITYVLHNTEGKFADLTIGPLIYAYNVLDYGADPTGELCNARVFNALIDRIGNLGGGTLYIPEGFYRLNSTVTIRKGVTIRGDWVKPDKNSPVADDGGTVLLAYVGRDRSERDMPLIETEVGAGVMNLTIFYPEQDPNNIVRYSPAIRHGVDNYFGNEYNNVKNVTIVNAYIGVLFSRTNGGGAPVVNGLYGSPIHTGVDVDNIAEVGRVEWLDFSPDYWINCGLYEKLGMDDPFSKDESAAGNIMRDYIYNNATGLIMRRNDWSYAAYLTVEGYLNGFMAAQSNSSMEGTPNGHNYNFYFTNCRNGVYIEATNSVGILFNKVIIENCEIGIKIGESTSGAVQFANSIIDAGMARYGMAIYIDQTSGTRLLVHETEIKRGQVLISGGTFQATDVDFNNKTSYMHPRLPDGPVTVHIPHVTIGSSGRANIAGCRFNGGEPDIQNNSFFGSNFDHEPLELKKAPEFPDAIQQTVKTPPRFELYIVERSNGDNTEAIQNALDKAAADGGGYVYLPAGKWRLDGYIIVPSGVELVGSMSNSSVPHGEGSILECYYGRNDESALPFIQLQENAGIRGITIDYPLQIYQELFKDEVFTPDFYPYAIQGQGNNIYAVNVGIRAAYAGLDLFTYKCDNFYVDWFTGHAFNNVVRVGGNSENGILSNLMFNTIVYACGDESKFGSFENSLRNGLSNSPVYDYAYANTDFLILGDSKNTILYNCFMFGVYRGVYFKDDGNGGPESGISMGTGIDAGTYSFYFGEGVNTKDFNFINTQIVTLIHSFSPNDTAYIYSAGNNNFDVNFYSLDLWGNPAYAVYMGENSGELNLINAHFNATGQAFANIKGGELVLLNGSFDRIDTIAANNSAQFVSIIASTIRDTGERTNAFAQWRSNISNAIEFSSGGIIASASIDRSDWQAAASHNSNLARRVYDGRISNRWDTGTAQVPDMWFELDLGGEYTFNYLIIDVGASTGDMAAEWSIFVSPDGENWGEPIASGREGNGIIQFPEQTASHIRIEQNGRKDGLYWSIHELYVLYVE